MVKDILPSHEYYFNNQTSSDSGVHLSSSGVPVLLDETLKWTHIGLQYTWGLLGVKVKIISFYIVSIPSLSKCYGIINHSFRSYAETGFLVLDLIRPSEQPVLISDDAGIVCILVYNLTMALLDHHSVCYVFKIAFINYLCMVTKT